MTDEPLKASLKASLLSSLEQKIHRWLVWRLIDADSLQHMAFKNDGLNHVDITLDDFPEAVRITIKAEWIDRKDTST